MKAQSIVLVWLMVLPFVNQTIVFTNFLVNRAEIAEKSCVNRFQESNCHGTCQLVKAVQKQESKDNKNPYTPNNQKVMNELLWFFQNLSLQFTDPTLSEKKLIVFSGSLNPYRFLSLIFRPPKV